MPSEARLRQLVEMAMAAFNDIKAKVEEVISDVSTCFDVLATSGPAAFEHAKLAIAAAREAAQAAAKRDFQLTASRAGDAQKAAMSVISEGEHCFTAIKQLIGGLAVAADGQTSSLKRHLEAAQSAAKEAVAATRQDMMGVVSEAKQGATEIRGAVDASASEIVTATQATTQKLAKIVTVTASAAAKQAVDTARSIVAEIESTSNGLRGIALDTMGKVSQTAHQLDVPGPEVAELQQTVDGAMAQQDDARLKLQKIKQLQGKLAGLSWGELGAIGQEVQAEVGKIVGAGQRTLDSARNFASSVKNTVSQLGTDVTTAITQRVDQWKGVGESAMKLFNETKDKVKKHVDEIKAKVDAIIKDAQKCIDDLKKSVDDLVQSVKDAVEKAKNLDVSGAMDVVVKGKKLFETGKQSWETARGHFERVKALVMSVKETVDGVVGQAGGLVSQASEAFQSTISAPQEVAGLVKSASEKLLGEANTTMATAASEFKNVMASASKLTDLASCTTSATVQMGISAGSSLAQSALNASKSALAAGQGVMATAKSAVGVFDENARKQAAKACDTALDAVKSSMKAIEDAAKATDKIASGDSAGAQQAASDVEQKAADAAQETAKAQKEAGDAEKNAKQAQADSTNPDAVEKKQQEQQAKADGKKDGAAGDAKKDAAGDAKKDAAPGAEAKKAGVPGLLQRREVEQERAPRRALAA